MPFGKGPERPVEGRVQFDCGQCPPDCLVGVGDAGQHGGQVDEVVEAVALEDTILLGHQTDLGPGGGIDPGVAAGHGDRSGRRRGQPAQDPQQRRLAARFGPSRAVTPGSTLNDTSDTATSDPNDLETWSATTVAVGEKTGGAEMGGGRGDRPGPGA